MEGIKRRKRIHQKIRKERLGREKQSLGASSDQPTGQGSGTHLPNSSSASSAVSDLYRWIGWKLYHSWSGNASIAPSGACVNT
jgi:hypothetical protein